MMTQHKTLTGSPIGTVRESFYDRMRRVAALNLRAASMSLTERMPDSARWFCLQVDKGREFAVEKDLHDANVEVFLPRETQLHVRRGRGIEVIASLFPGYLMVRFVPSAAAFSGIQRQRNVVGLVGDKYGWYHIVPDEVVSVFKRMGEEPIPRVATDKSFKQGDRADIVDGPFVGFECLIVSVKWCRQAKASVVIDLPGRSFEIDSMPLAFLKKL